MFNRNKIKGEMREKTKRKTAAKFWLGMSRFKWMANPGVPLALKMSHYFSSIFHLKCGT